MKLRTNKNSIRLRLSQAEVDDFKKYGFVHETISFSPLAKNQLEYSLIQADHDAISVSYLNNHLRVYVPVIKAIHWCDGDEVGFDCNIHLDGSNDLKVLVEKDFKCLQPRSGEDESDNFPNPNSSSC
jgi:hypothetical protein